MIQRVFPKNDAVFRDDTAGIIKSWFEEYEGKLEHLPRPAQPADLNISESFWSVLET
jgi:hypothetical protein